MIFGGETVAGGGDREEDEPAEVVRYLTPTQVEAVADVLRETDVEDLSERYDPDALEQAEIYPQGVWEEERQEAFEFVAEYYELLVDFYIAAAERGDAVLISIG